MTDTRNERREVEGIVVSDKMNKTVVVDVIRKVRHPKYGKVIEKKTRCYAHDEASEAKVGDVVRIMETRPLSKLKRWRVSEVIRAESAKGVTP
jgi:small subunit ribosomal protein S17